MKLNTEKLLKHILINANIKWRAEAVRWDYRGSTKGRFIGAMSVEEIFDGNTRFRFDLRVWLGGVEFDILSTEVVVIVR